VATDHFDEPMAAIYDATVRERFAPAELDPTVDLLADLAGGGPALELGIGTGRVALPLAARGVAVSGIDLSEAMVARLRAKPGGDALPVAVGDVATATARGGPFALAYLVFNTIKNLTTQDEQVACFANVARQLRPGGRFVVEVSSPALRLLPPGRSLVAWEVDEAHVGVDEYDVAGQRLWSHHQWVVDGVAHRRSIPCRYAWPAELDLMARLAGMALVERWGGFDRSPFTSESDRHVSVWATPA